MTRLHMQTTVPIVNSGQHSEEHEMHFQAGYTDSFNLMRIEAILLRIVGRKGLDALLSRSHQICGPHASSAALVNRLVILSSDLLGIRIAQRLLHPERRKADELVAF